MLPVASTAADVRRRELTIDEYFTGVRAGNRTVLARALTLVESSCRRHQLQANELLARLWPHTGGSIRVGITGVPGAGKSTFIEVLGLHLVRNGRRVAVLAVDSSSDISGGSILGDKTRMTRLAIEPTAYIRPSSSAGTQGGVARKTREAMLVCEAAGFDVVLIETVGVGQVETIVADMTDCLLALVLPGAGDDLQAIKRGLLERVDVLVVNKADGLMAASAAATAEQYRQALSTTGRAGEPRTVLTCSALRACGIAEVWQAVERRQAWLQASGALATRRGEQQLNWLWTLVKQQFLQALEANPKVQALRGPMERNVREGILPAATAARRLLEAFV